MTRLFGDGVLAVTLGQLDGLAGALPQIVELGPSLLAAADRFDIKDIG